MITNIEKLSRSLFKGAGAESSKSVSEYVVDGLQKPVSALAFPAEEISPEEAQKAVQERIAEIQKMAADPNAPTLLQSIAALLTSLLSLLPGIAGTAGVAAEKNILQPIRKQVRPLLLGPTEALEASRRGIPTNKNPSDIPDYYLEQLRRTGIPDNQIEILRKLQWYIPTASDIISFAVREVYSPEKWGTPPPTEDFDLVYKMAKDDIKKAGMDEATFAKFWQAHWILPSVMQGFEMLHRGIIKAPDLDRLMIMLDIMPEWRDKLKDISFNPLTRVDVRRMHKLLVLKDADLIQAYKDIGYSDINAERMKEFTIEYNNDPEAAERTGKDAERAKEKDLTKADILSGYRDRLITLQDTKDMLFMLGYEADEYEFYIAKEDFKREHTLLKKAVEEVHRAFTKGIYTEKESRDRLATFSVPSTYTDDLVNSWKLEVEVPTATPSKAELLRWFKSNTIDEFTLEESLSKMGYSEKYIRIYIEEVKKAKAAK